MISSHSSLDSLHVVARENGASRRYHYSPDTLPFRPRRLCRGTHRTSPRIHPTYQQPASSTFSFMPGPCMMSSRLTGNDDARLDPRPRVWWHRVLSLPHRTPPPQRAEVFFQRGEARPSRFFSKGRCSWLPNEEGEKNFYLEELKIFLVKGSV